MTYIVRLLSPGSTTETCDHADLVMGSESDHPSTTQNFISVQTTCRHKPFPVPVSILNQQASLHLAGQLMVTRVSFSPSYNRWHLGEQRALSHSFECARPCYSLAQRHRKVWTVCLVQDTILCLQYTAETGVQRMAVNEHAWLS
jgi:hypothetical protein